jgi:hypothetical protein
MKDEYNEMTSDGHTYVHPTLFSSKAAMFSLKHSFGTKRTAN